MIEQTLYFIKPDAYDHREIIGKEITARFRIIQRAIILLNEEIIQALYPCDINKPYFSAIIQYLTQHHCNLGVVEGEDIRKKFLEFAGEQPIPDECAPHTIRYRFSRGFVFLGDGNYITMNAIHRTKDLEEFLRDIELLRRYQIRI